MGALAGRHAVVTGGGRGIGAAIGRALVERGAVVTLLGRDRERLAATARELGAGSGSVVADVTDAASLEVAFAAARDRAGAVTLLVNNAGQAASAPAGRTDAGLWQRMLAVNLTGAMLCVQQALPDMLQAGHGRIVNISSTAGLVGYAYCAAYCAAKHGLVGLTRALAAEFALNGITVNAVCPGFTDTDIVSDAVANISERTGRSNEQAMAALVARNPQRRLVRPEEVAATVAWLCDPASESLTGQSITVAGGEVT